MVLVVISSLLTRERERVAALLENQQSLDERERERVAALLENQQSLDERGREGSHTLRKSAVS